MMCIIVGWLVWIIYGSSDQVPLMVGWSADSLTLSSHRQELNRILCDRIEAEQTCDRRWLMTNDHRGLSLALRTDFSVMKMTVEPDVI